MCWAGTWIIDVGTDNLDVIQLEQSVQPLLKFAFFIRDIELLYHSCSSILWLFLNYINYIHILHSLRSSKLLRSFILVTVFNFNLSETRKKEQMTFTFITNKYGLHICTKFGLVCIYALFLYSMFNKRTDTSWLLS